MSNRGILIINRVNTGQGEGEALFTDLRIVEQLYIVNNT